nr:unnamed protein product [Digitaria exilis]
MEKEKEKTISMAPQTKSTTRMVALLVAALVVAAASLPAATAYGCYDDCYERCSNGKEDPACTKMCNQACGPVDLGAAAINGIATAMKPPEGAAAPAPAKA